MLFSALLLSFVLEYVNPDRWIAVIGALKVGTIVPVSVFVLSLAQLRPTTNRMLLSHPSTKWLLLFFLLFAIAVPTADVTLRSFDAFKNMLANVFWYVMIVKLVTDYDKLKKVFAVLIWSHIVILALSPDVVLNPITRSYVRGAPFLGDGNDFALSACIVLPMCLVMIRSAGSRMAKYAYIGAATILGLAIVATQSRGGSLALAACLFFLWWNSRTKMASALLIVIALIGVAMFAPPEYMQRMQSISDYEQDSSAMGRITNWKAAVRMARKYPLTGVSSGHFPIALGTEFRPSEWGDHRELPWTTAHSMYFLVLGELGFPGIICFLALLLGNYFRLRRLSAKVRDGTSKEDERFSFLFLMLATSLIGLAVAGAFLSAAYYPHVYVLSGLVVAATFIYERACNESTTQPEPPQNSPSGRDRVSRKQ